MRLLCTVQQLRINDYTTYRAMYILQKEEMKDNAVRL